MVRPPSGSGEIKRISFIHGQRPVAIQGLTPFGVESLNYLKIKNMVLKGSNLSIALGET
jgi:hypothetical protein